MTKLVYKQIQQLNYKKETACNFKATRSLAIGFFVCFLDYFTNLNQITEEPLDVKLQIYGCAQ